MTKFLKKCFWFLTVIVAVNILYLLVLFCFSPSFKKIYEISNFRRENFDLIVLGNSMALDGIDAEYLSSKGLSTYNLAVAGDHVSTSLLLLEDYLKKNNKPKMVVVGLSSAIGRSYLNPVAYVNPEVEFFYHPSLFSNISTPPLLNFQWLAVDLVKILISKDHRNAKIVKGQWQTQKVIPDQSSYKNGVVKSIDYRDQYLQKIVEICSNQRIRLVLIELPGANSNRNSLPFEYLVKLNDKSTHKVYNLNNYEVSSRMLNSSSDWLAIDHLNQNGGRKITVYILDHILKSELNTPLMSEKKTK